MKHIGGDGSPLHLPIGSLGMSDELVHHAQDHGYQTLYDLQQLTLNDLLELEWFTTAMFMELAVMLKKLHNLVSA